MMKMRLASALGALSLTFTLWSPLAQAKKTCAELFSEGPLPESKLKLEHFAPAEWPLATHKGLSLLAGPLEDVEFSVSHMPPSIGNQLILPGARVVAMETESQVLTDFAKSHIDQWLLNVEEMIFWALPYPTSNRLVLMSFGNTLLLTEILPVNDRAVNIEIQALHSFEDSLAQALEPWFSSEAVASFTPESGHNVSWQGRNLDRFEVGAPLLMALQLGEQGAAVSLKRLHGFLSQITELKPLDTPARTWTEQIAVFSDAHFEAFFYIHDNEGALIAELVALTPSPLAEETL